MPIRNQDLSDAAESHANVIGGDAQLLPQTLGTPPDVVEVVRHGRILRWEYLDAPLAPWAPDYRNALGGFIRLKKPDDIPAFARRYGVLHLCKQHGLPWSHNPPAEEARRVVGYRYMDTNEPGMKVAVPVEQEDWGCLSLSLDGKGQEHATDWLKFARMAEAILRLAGMTARSTPTVAPRTLLTDDAWNLIPGYPEIPASLEQARFKIEEAVDDWLRWGNVRPTLTWGTQDQPSLGYDPGKLGLFGVLALQLATEVATARALYVCAGCGTPYARLKRLPKPGQRNFCDECGTKVATRLAMREWRRRGAA